jgi:XTP/dITP diphosphohydrolase
MFVTEFAKKLILDIHIYSDVVVTDEEEVKREWENWKLRGKNQFLEGVPRITNVLSKANSRQSKDKFGIKYKN